MGISTLQTALLAGILAGSTLTAPALAAAGVARWVDDQGVTHFTDRQFAPARAQTLEIGPANGMDVPVTTGGSVVDTSPGPRVAVIEYTPTTNPKGRRERRESIYTGRKHSNNLRGR